MRIVPAVSDEELAGRVAAGDLAAFASLYDQYAPRVFAWAAHLLGRDEAEDATQEILLRLWDRADRYDARRGPFAPWFYAVARHELIARARSRTREVRVVATDEIERLLFDRASSADTEAAAIARVAGDELIRALRTLPVQQRRVLVLAYFGGLSQSEIARGTSTPLGTVKKRTRLALAKLRAALRGSAGAGAG